jgi:hypothetical protein
MALRHFPFAAGHFMLRRCSSSAQALSMFCATTLPSPATEEFALVTRGFTGQPVRIRTIEPHGTAPRRQFPRRATALERRFFSLCEWMVFANARLSTRPAGATVVPMHADVSVRKRELRTCCPRRSMSTAGRSSAVKAAPPTEVIRHRVRLRRSTLGTGYCHVLSDFRSFPK